MIDKSTLAALFRYAPSVARSLASCQHGSYGEYMASIMSGNPSFHYASNSCRLEAREILFRAIEHEFGEGPTHQLKNFPSIQTGSHNQLILDRMTFNSYVSQIIGISRLNLSFLIAFSASAISLTTEGRIGPAWLDSGGGGDPFVAASRSYLDKGSVISSEPVKLIRSAELWNQPAPLVSALDTCIDWAGKRQLCDVIISANTDVISSMTKRRKIVPCIFDERLVGKILLEHLNRETVVSDIVLDERVHSFVLESIRSQEHGFLGPFLLRRSPMLWHVDGHRLRPVSLLRGRLQSEGGNWSAPLSTGSLSEALVQGTIVPGPFISLCIIGLLPGISLVGGLRQIAYLPVFSRIIEEAIRLCGASPIEIGEDLNCWGMRVDDCPTPPRALIPDINSGHFLNHISDERGQTPLMNITQNFEVFRAHPFWGKAMQFQ